MKNKTALITLILSAALLFSGCKTVPNEKNDKPTDNESDFVDPMGPVDPTGSVDPTEPTESEPEEVVFVISEDFVFPKTDGSTSTTNLDNAVRSAVLGGEQKAAHSKTYTSFENLLKGNCELIFTTPLSAAQLQTMEDEGFKYEAEPVAGEGFVFVVNKDNPVDTLTIEEIKGIYSGEITNWSEVGGNDSEIIAYQRNADSGSQNYMISFMGATPLMKPITDVIPASMSGILDVVANYDNGINAIGYSVYAYSDGMYENISEIKYIKVNGVEPSLKTLADGRYPLLGYNYAVFSADEPEDSNVRALVKWIQSDAGQQVIADAGYIPYRRVDGLTLPEPTTKVLYSASATSGIAKPDDAADYYYDCYKTPGSFTTAGLDKKIQAFIDEATDELSGIDETEIKSFVDSRAEYLSGSWSDLKLLTRKKLVNGYLSVVVGLRYSFEFYPFMGIDFFYDVRTAVFDIYTGKQLELSDLFFDGVDIVPLLNKHIAAESVMPISGWNITYEMLHDFSGLYEGDFSFTADSIIFRPGICFADGVEISLAELYEYMVTSIPRDMAGYVEENTPIFRDIKYGTRFGYGEEKNGISIWYLDKEKTTISDEVCDKVNAFIDETYETYFTEEKLLAAAKERGFDAESVEIGPFPDFDLIIVGNRYIEFSGANLAFVYNVAGGQFNVIDRHYLPNHFCYYFDAQTGEELRIGELFVYGWQDNAKYYIVDDSFSAWGINTWTEYTAEFDVNNSRILEIYSYADEYSGSGRKETAIVIVEAENGDMVAVAVPKEYIK